MAMLATRRAARWVKRILALWNKAWAETGVKLDWGWQAVGTTRKGSTIDRQDYVFSAVNHLYILGIRRPCTPLGKPTNTSQELGSPIKDSCPNRVVSRLLPAIFHNFMLNTDSP